MSKIHPSQVSPDHHDQSTASEYSHASPKEESFTIWMKSLVMQTYGCTVFNDNGEVVYRVENYDRKGSDEVYLMDVKGRVLFTILRQKRSLFRRWKGYKSDGQDHGNQKKPFFNVRKASGVMEGETMSYLVTVDLGLGGIAQHNCYKLETSAGKSAFKILNNNGGVVAEAKRKQSCSGVQLGDDVLTLVVQPSVDHSFIMALVTVYGLLNHIL